MQGALLAQPGALLPPAPGAPALVPEPEAAAWLAGLPKALWQLGAGRPAASAAALAMLHDAARFRPRCAPVDSPVGGARLDGGPVTGALAAQQPQLAVLFAAPAPGAAGGASPKGEARLESRDPEARGKRGAAAAAEALPSKRRKKGQGAPASAEQPLPNAPAPRGRPASAGAGAPALVAAAAAAGGDAAGVQSGAMVPGPLARLPAACQVRTASPHQGQSHGTAFGLQPSSAGRACWCWCASHDVRCYAAGGRVCAENSKRCVLGGLCILMYNG